MNLREVSTEVLQAEGPVVRLTRDDIHDLKSRAARSPHARARICAHPGPDDPTQEMLIVLARANDIRVHKHPGKVESFHVMEGLLSVVLFSEDGSVLETVAMGDYASGRAFYYRQTVPLYHAILPESDYVAFQEVPQGPFSREGTVYPTWCPAGGAELHTWLSELKRRVGAEAK